MSAVMAQTYVGNSTVMPDENTTVKLLSGFQYFLLCLVVAASYYFALYVSALAVGESTTSLGAPFTVIMKLFADVGNTIMKKINRRRNNTQAGAVSYEEVVDDSNDGYTINQPAVAAQ